MPLTPGYGETPLPQDELIALLPHVVEVLDKPISRADVYDLEQAVQEQVSEDLLTAAFAGSLQLGDLLSDYFLRFLHTRLYGDIWSWAGRWRRHEVNIGVAPEQIAVELRNVFDNIRYGWDHTDDWTPRELGIVAHAETVRVHPFTDGNGRTTRLLADLVFITEQDPAKWQYDWDVDKERYIDLLRGFDVHRNVRELAAFIGVQSTEA
jgi:fido (protein-threonine AMPylation protein)